MTTSTIQSKLTGWWGPANGLKTKNGDADRRGVKTGRSGVSAAWERFIYIIRIHWIAIKWTFIQLFTAHQYFDTTRIESREAQLAIVTGGAAGIGAEIVRKLYACDMHVIIASPDLDAAVALKEDILSNDDKHTFGGIEVAYLDLASFSSIRDFARHVTNRNSRIKLLINNAGVMFPPFALTEDGIETTLQVNYLGPFLLTYCLLPLLKNGGTCDLVSRVINVSSVVHYCSSGIDFETDFTLNKNVYKAYANTKLMQILYTNFMNRLMLTSNADVMFASVHPGIVNSNLYRNVFYVKWIRWLMKLIYRTPAQGADGIVFAALAMEMEDQGGTFSGNCELLEPHPECYNETVQKKLWDISCEMVGVPKAPRTSARLSTRRTPNARM